MTYWIHRRLVSLTAVALAIAVPVSAHALSFDQNVTPDVIFGSGNANGGFTVDTNGGLELGLRAKLRFDAANQPQNVFNSNGDGTYSFDATLPPTGFGFAPGSASTAIWNFEWAINTDTNDATNITLGDLVYEIQIDFDAGVGTSFLSFDPINQTYADHAIGNNATLNGAGATAADAAAYAGLIASENVAQNSWNMEFFDDAGAGFPFAGDANGQYEIILSAKDSGGNLLASTQISVIAGTGAAPVPEPNAALLFGVGLFAVGCRLRRRSPESGSAA